MCVRRAKRKAWETSVESKDMVQQLKLIAARCGGIASPL